MFSVTQNEGICQAIYEKASRGKDQNPWLVRLYNGSSIQEKVLKSSDYLLKGKEKRQIILKKQTPRQTKGLLVEFS